MMRKVSKVILIACDYLLVSKLPQKGRKNEENRLFYQNQDSDNPGQKSLGQYFNIHIFVSFLGSLLKQCVLFEIFLQFCLPPPYTKLKLGKILDTCVQHYLWGEGRGWTCMNWKTPQKCPKTFVHDCR